jgi:hypothetical protein
MSGGSFNLGFESSVQSIGKPFAQASIGSIEGKRAFVFQRLNNLQNFLVRDLKVFLHTTGQNFSFFPIVPNRRRINFCLWNNIFCRVCKLRESLQDTLQTWFLGNYPKMLQL